MCARPGGGWVVDPPKLVSKFEFLIFFYFLFFIFFYQSGFFLNSLGVEGLGFKPSPVLFYFLSRNDIFELGKEGGWGFKSRG